MSRGAATDRAKPGNAIQGSAEGRQGHWLENLKARAPTSRQAAVRLFCIECMGGSRKDAITCSSTKCPLWPHAFARGRAL